MKRIEYKAINSIELGFDNGYHFILIIAKGYKFKRLFSKLSSAKKHYQKIENKLQSKYKII